MKQTFNFFFCKKLWLLGLMFVMGLDAIPTMATVQTMKTKVLRQVSFSHEPSCQETSHSQTPSSQVLFAEDFRWGLLREEMLNLFQSTYQSSKRLWNYARIRGDQILLPYRAIHGGTVELPLRVAEVIASHIEMALQRRFVEAVFFPDMGHSHFLIPDEVYADEYAKIPVKQYNQLYQKLFTDERVMILYHTAEQLAFLDQNNQVKDDPYYQWRHKTRNLLASTKLGVPLRILENPKSPANTVHEVPGYRWWGAGFQISAHHNGCFVYQHGLETRRFDISLYDLPSKDSFTE